MSKDRVIWIDRGWQPVAIGFVPSQAAWDKEMKRVRMPEPWPGKAHCGGYTHLAVNDTTGEAIIYVIVFEASERNALEVISTIVHEAVHVWQFLCRHIGEDSPGIEMEAYGIQMITEGLINAYTSTQGKGKQWL
ncbi:hypothetical protein REJC140_00118 [Pseudorhizobium endolithicum]|uniref:SprT-like domain-containing protein n=1 Tax=Pseudorhizobium endolithicum TaxID=1191678 RepID=A0ABN7JB52_9HYPH|nr:hypothetical protein [Pseudorhizobium endolithicum]CAD7023175.1 hypothetical protein REJC140_00118 [Pseudorhizobium endolithicum]